MTRLPFSKSSAKLIKVVVHPDSTPIWPCMHVEVLYLGVGSVNIWYISEIGPLVEDPVLHNFSKLVGAETVSVDKT